MENTNNHALNRISQAVKNGETVLDLSYCGLKNYLSPKIKDLTHLVELKLDDDVDPLSEEDDLESLEKIRLDTRQRVPVYFS